MRRVFLFGIVVFANLFALAQVEYSRNEVGVQVGYALSESDLERSLVNLGARYTLNLNSILAIDSEFDFYPQSTVPSANRGGRQFTFFTGLKGGIRRPRFGIFGKMRPGLRHYTATGIASEQPNVTEGRTHYALDLGGVVEYYPGNRWIVRFDISEILTRLGDHVDLRFFDNKGNPVVLFIATPRISSSLSATLGISYRLGRRKSETETVPGRPNPPRMQAGVQYSLLDINRISSDEMFDHNGVGGWFSYQFHKNVAFDSSISYFPENPLYVNPQEGGTILQGLFGIKAGVTKDRVGIFAKFRPGFMRFSKSLTDYTWIDIPGAGPPPFQPVTQLAFDMGGVLEYYPSRSWVVRLDFGDTTVHYFERKILTSQGPGVWSAETGSSMQMSIGFGLRF